MFCAKCGAPPSLDGGAHRCARVNEGELETFAVASRRVIRFAVTYIIVAVATAVLASVGADALVRGATDPTGVGPMGFMVVFAMIAGFLALVCLIGLVVCTIVWIVSAHRVTDAGPGIAGYSALFLTLALITASYVLSGLPNAYAVTGLRFGGLIVLIIGVVLTRNRIRRLTDMPIPSGKKSLITEEDWKASEWDPEVQREIERRGRPTD
ncbi:hypothetical protein Aca07nite_23410 [Actinoplanes capillaceus]|uniref:Tryptophan-associated transmembrane protein (Trp_oprn_chp) n=1 Tax=Actinoplanes campanulatus TaxID=113559 RepID=A0ABQ3WFT8_9ACTN|nr:hypothetical protein [Actinoplanes capillaceus]GID45066.1 hypothetical protein Aca07nite_23410 [Actinoplanes capillaceus]